MISVSATTQINYVTGEMGAPGGQGIQGATGATGPQGPKVLWDVTSCSIILCRSFL